MPSTVAVLLGAGAVGGWLGIASSNDPAAATPSGYDAAISGCSAVDGDTVRCGSERIRLVGLDTAEMPGHCRPGRRCVQGDPHAAKASLAAALIGDLRITRVGEDHYGRTLAVVAGGKGDLSCWQLKQGQAVYKPAWDDESRVAQTCPGALARVATTDQPTGVRSGR